MLERRTLGHVQLAQEHRARLGQLRHDRGVVGRLEIGVDRHPAGGSDALGEAQILHRDRDAVQGAPVEPLADLGLRLSRLLQREVGRYGGVTLETGIEGLDPGEDGLGDLNRGEIARGDVLGDRRQRLVVDFVE